MLLQDKVVVVTGATKGIGRAIALGAARSGARLALGGRDQTAGESLLAEIRELGAQAVFVPGDLSQPPCCQALVSAATDRFGRLDGLVNYAGTVCASAPLKETDEQMLDWILGVNFKSAFFTTQAAVAAMAGRGGSIVFMGSLHAFGGEKDRPAYACSKGAMYTLYRHMARNYAGEGIRSNWVTIGWVATPGEVQFRKRQGLGEDWLDSAGESVMPMGRLQTEEDYVGAVLYLLSDLAGQTCGSEIKITGGFSL